MANRRGLTISIGPEIEEWKKWVLAFDGNLRASSERATKKASQYVLAEIQLRIRGGRYRKLQPMTALLRNLEGYGQTPLLKRGRLIRAITSDLKNPFESHVGLLAQFASQRDRDPVTGRFKKGGEKMTNIGKLLHDGGLIKVTDKMRRAFAIRLTRLAKKGQVSLLRNGGSSTGKKGYIRIRPRRFIAEVFEDPAVLKKINEIYYQEIEKGVF